MQLLTDEVENEITLTAFRLLTLDLLSLYSVMNEGTINVLGMVITQRAVKLESYKMHRTVFRDVATGQRARLENIQDLYDTNRGSRPVPWSCEAFRSGHKT